jgi:predicted XRE-type DNA-binding protein
MKNSTEFRKTILNQPEYWIESINAEIYNLLINFMEEKKLKKQDLAAFLGISAGRVSQLLNDGECNFNINTLIEISLKLETFPVLKFENQQNFIAVEQKEKHLQSLFFTSSIGVDFGFSSLKKTPGRPKTIQMFANTNTISNESFKVNEYSLCK